MLAFGEAAHFGEYARLQYATIEQPIAIAAPIAAPITGYWLGPLPLPRWSGWIVTVLWLTALAIGAFALGTHDIECSIDPHTRANAMRIWIGVPALAAALASPAFLGRTLSSKHIIALPTRLGFAALGILLTFAVAFNWLTRQCISVVY